MTWLEFHHVSVLLEESLKGLQLKSGGIYIDCTLGGAGHSSEIVKAIGPTGVLIGIDQDKNALAAAEKKLSNYSANIKLVHSNFRHIKEIAQELDVVNKVDGILFDLGVSSHQLDEGERGFSYRYDAPLDMRMNIEDNVTAKDLVNQLSQDELNNIIWEYGEERWAKRIAEFIVAERKVKTIETTGELVEIIKKAIPAGARKEGPHPAKRTFQALRIAVNSELDILTQTFKDAVEILNTKGRLCVITFHSLEDRITKQTFQELAKKCICPPSLPICTCIHEKQIKIITGKPILPSDEELEINHRARSAKLRIAEKL